MLESIGIRHDDEVLYRELLSRSEAEADELAGAPGRQGRGIMTLMPAPSDERNVLGEPLQPCGTEPMTGFYRDGACSCGDDDVGLHAVCAVVTEEFLLHQRAVGNDLSTPLPQFGFPGLNPGDRWCVVAARWLQAYHDGIPAPVVLASTNQRALEVIPLSVLEEHAVDVPPDLSGWD